MSTYILDIFVFVSEQWLLISAFLILLFIFLSMERSNSGKPMATSVLVAVMNADQVILVDVRVSGKFQEGHIHGALNIPHTKSNGRVSELEKHRQKLIVLVDQMGQHAGSAGKLLTKDGFSVRRLKGGMSEWQHQSMPVVQGQKN